MILKMANDKTRNKAEPAKLLSVVSYNLHGLNQGLPGINHLIDTMSPDVIMNQEHWLTSENLHKLSDISDNYFMIGSSAMDNCLASGPLFGRPFGGTAVLIKKEFINVTVNIATSERYCVVRIANWLLINVYLPCSGTPNRILLLNDILCEIQGIILNNHDCDCLFAGDFNSDLSDPKSNAVNKAINAFIYDNRLNRCDILFPTGSNVTYINESLSCSSTIDYIVTSNSNRTVAFNVLDIDINLSDHLPIMVLCELDSFVNPVEIRSDVNVSFFRWDHAPLNSYYEQTRVALQPVLEELNILTNNKSLSMVDTTVIDKLYNCVVTSLQLCSNNCIPKCTKQFYKFWWSQELTELKDRAIASHRMWKDSGRPRYGPIFTKYKQDKLLYKKRIREDRIQETSSYTNDLHEALIHKSGRDFWKQWNSKFENKNCKNRLIQVDGTVDNLIILDKFAKYFEQLSTPFNVERNNELRDKYMDLRPNYKSLPVFKDTNIVSVELISKLLSSMKNGRAAGLDQLTSEHLKYCHPIIIVILSKLFNCFIATQHLPDSFGASYIVPIPKCDGRKKSLHVDDFRGISISPVISKLFELCVLDLYDDYFDTSDYQFGFKKNLGSSHIIFCVRSVIDHYVSNGSTINVCSLDLSKAFDKMNHYSLLLKLIERNFPIEILAILEKWFDISVTCVKWNNITSPFFKLETGVRQGGVWSPVLFAILIDELVSKVTSTKVGCYNSTICICIFLYADDIILLSPTVTGLQILLNAVENELLHLDMQLNVKKSLCIRFGVHYDKQCASIVSIHGITLQWVTECRYLGVYFKAGRVFSCSFTKGKNKFFTSFNGILSKVFPSASEEVIISLLKSKCLPHLLYCTESLPVSKRDKNSLDFTLTRSLMKLFHTSSIDIVTECQINFNLLPIRYQIDMKTTRFLLKFVNSSNSICSMFFSNAFSIVNSIFSVYDVSSVSDMCSTINEQFEQFAHSS
jgi:exonuclease III